MKAMRCEGAPVTVFQGRRCFPSTIRRVSTPGKLLGAITRRLRSILPPKKIQLRPWFLHRWWSCYLLRFMHVTISQALLELLCIGPPAELLTFSDATPELVKKEEARNDREGCETYGVMVSKEMMSDGEQGRRRPVHTAAALV
ncbi:Uncharacterized protein Rs2_38386 [Raphanus sativus]|nr:Uncharacterized protein Rs2_38386 [Raphanus sativus]